MSIALDLLRYAVHERLIGHGQFTGQGHCIKYADCHAAPHRGHAYRCDRGHRLNWTTGNRWLAWAWCPQCQDYRDWTARPQVRSCFLNARLQVGSASERLIYGPRAAQAYSQVLRMRDDYLTSGEFDGRVWRRLGYAQIYAATVRDTGVYYAALDRKEPEPFIPADSPREAYEFFNQTMMDLKA